MGDLLAIYAGCILDISGLMGSNSISRRAICGFISRRAGGALVCVRCVLGPLGSVACC